MRKIPTIYVRDHTDPHRPVVTDQPHRAAGWVFAGEGIARRKHDGTAVRVTRDGNAVNLWTRRMVKAGRPAPAGFRELEVDPVTGHRFGWVGFAADARAREINETVLRDTAAGRVFLPGTYELVGPKVNGNPEQHERHELIAHATAETVDYTPPADPADAVDFMLDLGIAGWEGIVWHHPDGRRTAKLKVRDVVALQRALSA